MLYHLFIYKSKIIFMEPHTQNNTQIINLEIFKISNYPFKQFRNILNNEFTKISTFCNIKNKISVLVV